MYERFLPRTAKSLKKLISLSAQGPGAGESLSTTDRKEIFEGCDKTSIDIGLIEKIDNIATVKADFEWNDLGSFDSFYRVLEKDGKGNVVIGKASVKGCSNSLFISSGDRVIGARGVKEHLVAESNEGVLIIPRNSSQAVREISEEAHRLKACYSARDVDKPWGSFHVLEDQPGYKAKKLVLLPGAALSLQMHRQRNEKWIIVKGRATVRVGETVKDMEYGESVFIPAQTKHRLENRTKKVVEIIEVQTGTYFGEDDIIRYEDIYDRL
jgi:mannose-6-phosphate isomerase-like protein (cupin superfamily)